MNNLIMGIKTIDDWNEFITSHDVVDTTSKHSDRFMVYGQVAGGYFEFAGDEYRLTAWKNKSVSIQKFHNEK